MEPALETDFQLLVGRVCVLDIGFWVKVFGLRVLGFWGWGCIV